MLFSDNQALMSLAQTKAHAFNSLLALRSHSAVSSDIRAHADTIYRTMEDSYEQFVIETYSGQEEDLNYHRSVVQSGTEALVQTAKEWKAAPLPLARFSYS